MQLACVIHLYVIPVFRDGTRVMSSRDQLTMMVDAVFNMILTFYKPAVLQSAPIIVNLCSFYKHSDRLSFSLNQHSVCMVFDVNGDNSKNGNGFYMSINLSPSLGGGRSISQDAGDV